MSEVICSNELYRNPYVNFWREQARSQDRLALHLRSSAYLSSIAVGYAEGALGISTPVYFKLRASERYLSVTFIATETTNLFVQGYKLKRKQIHLKNCNCLGVVIEQAFQERRNNSI